MQAEVTSFGKILRELRESAGLRLREVAALLDIDHSLLGKFERNERHPTRKLISKIATIYNQSKDDLTIHLLSDQFADQILKEKTDLKILKLVRKKVKLHINNRVTYPHSKKHDKQKA